MPYIKSKQKEYFDELLQTLQHCYISGPGELNYLVTSLVIHYLTTHPVSYGTYNEIVGALESAKLELYRRKIAPYEDTKITENGEVYK